jgi:uncharacterized membrane protein
LTETSEPRESGERARRTRTTRLEAFSDGVFAIAITLLVLDLAVPVNAQADSHLLDAIADEWPGYLGYIVSFATVGAMWLGHDAITDYLDHADTTLLRLNLLLLLLVSFLPFPTRLLSEYVTHDKAEAVASTFYGLTLLASAAVLFCYFGATRCTPNSSGPTPKTTSCHCSGSASYRGWGRMPP